MESRWLLFASIDRPSSCQRTVTNKSIGRMEPPMAQLSRKSQRWAQKPTREPSTQACVHSIDQVRHVVSGRRAHSLSGPSLVLFGRSHAGRLLRRSRSMAKPKDPRPAAAARKTRRTARSTPSQATLVSQLLMQALSAFHQAPLFRSRPPRPSLCRLLCPLLLKGAATSPTRSYYHIAYQNLMSRKRRS